MSNSRNTDNSARPCEKKTMLLTTQVMDVQCWVSHLDRHLAHDFPLAHISYPPTVENIIDYES